MAAGEQRLGRMQQASPEAVDAGRRNPRAIGQHEARARRQHSVEQPFAPGRGVGDIAVDRLLARGERNVFGHIAEKARTERRGRGGLERRDKAGLDRAGKRRLGHHRYRAAPFSLRRNRRQEPLNQL
jgi:hypothetical protein